MYYDNVTNRIIPTRMSNVPSHQLLGYPGAIRATSSIPSPIPGVDLRPKITTSEPLYIQLTVTGLANEEGEDTFDALYGPGGMIARDLKQARKFNTIRGAMSVIESLRRNRPLWLVGEPSIRTESDVTVGKDHSRKERLA